MSSALFKYSRGSKDADICFVRVVHFLRLACASRRRLVCLVKFSTSMYSRGPVGDVK
jgi:hypothetical protein